MLDGHCLLVCSFKQSIFLQYSMSLVESQELGYPKKALNCTTFNIPICVCLILCEGAVLPCGPQPGLRTQSHHCETTQPAVRIDLLNQSKTQTLLSVPSDSTPKFPISQNKTVSFCIVHSVLAGLCYQQILIILMCLIVLYANIDISLILQISQMLGNEMKFAVREPIGLR